MSEITYDGRRNLIDLSHLCYSQGNIGRLQTAFWHPVLPGDGYELDWVGRLTLSPLRRGLVVDSKVDIATFYHPYRNVYGDDWVNFIEQGVDESVTLSTETANPGLNSCASLGINGNEGGEVMPKWIPQTYRDIWNNYFRPPQSTAEWTTTHGSWSDDELIHGRKVAHLKRLWNATADNNLTTADTEVSTAGDTLDLYDLAEQKAILMTEQEREFFNVRYRDIMRNRGGSTPYESDLRPRLIMRSSFWASGYDIDGTGQESLGQFSGRVAQSFNHRVPRTMIGEHGVMWTVITVRFPPIHEDEQHFLFKKSQPTYKEIAADPILVEEERPYAATVNEFFNTTDTFGLGLMPYAQWYREHPHAVHPVYKELQGFPFLVQVPTNEDNQRFVSDSNYDDVFQTIQLGHWQVQSRANVGVMRRLPSAREAIMYGG